MWPQSSLAFRTHAFAKTVEAKTPPADSHVGRSNPRPIILRIVMLEVVAALIHAGVCVVEYNRGLSHAGAHGMIQLMPATAKISARHVGDPDRISPRREFLRGCSTLEGDVTPRSPLPRRQGSFTVRGVPPYSEADYVPSSGPYVKTSTGSRPEDASVIHCAHAEDRRQPLRGSKANFKSKIKVGRCRAVLVPPHFCLCVCLLPCLHVSALL